MEKDALLEIVLQDLKEVEALVQSFKGKQTLSKAFLKLTRNKINGILEEIDMLEELTNQNSSDINVEGKITPEKNSQKPSGIENNNSGPAEEEQALPETKKQSDRKPKDQIIPEQDVPEINQNIIPVDSPEKNGEERKKEKTQADAPKTPSKNTDAHFPTSKKSFPETTPADTQQETTGNVISSETKKDNKVLGEKLIAGKSSFNEQIAQKVINGPAKRLLTSSPPVSDLRKALGINDRFFYKRELFGNNADLMNQTLDQLNQMDSINDARNFLLTNFNWDTENEAMISFMELIERRFLK